MQVGKDIEFIKLDEEKLSILTKKLLDKNISRVAIVGSAGVGKTTLLENLFLDEIIKAKFTKIPEMVRVQCEKRGYESPYEIPEDEIHKFREEILDLQIELEDKSEAFIADRSSIDAWAYFMRWSWNNVDVEDAERFYQKAFKQAQKYNLFIYMPISFEQEEDGFRWVNKDYQRQIDRLIVSLIKDWGVEVQCW